MAKEKMVQLNFRVPAALKKQMLLALRRLGRRGHGDFSEACREAIRIHVERLAQLGRLAMEKAVRK